MMQLYGSKNKKCKSIELREVCFSMYDKDIDYLANFLNYVKEQRDDIINDPSKALDTKEGDIAQSHWHLRDWDKDWEKKNICDLIICVQFKTIRNDSGELIWVEQ